MANRTQHLFAACRVPDQAEELQKVAEAHKHVIILKLDVTNKQDIAACVEKISEVVGDTGLNCLINNAAQICRSDIESFTGEELRDLFEVNTIAPAMIIKACLPLLRQASSQHSNAEMRVARSSIINISSKVGSIADNSSGRNYGYRMSKVAMNMLTKNLSVELKTDHILAISLHPGWVQTNMGGPNALISTGQCVQGLLKVAEGLTEKDNGMFYGWNGEHIPW